jgi:tetratricopeptide (TPR) repeat protein
VGSFSFLDRPDRARTWLARYDADVKDTVRLRIDLPVRQRVEAHVLLAEGKTAEAIALYRKSDRLPDGPRNTCTSCLPINLAFAFSKAGEADSTIFYATQALTIFDANRVADYQDQFVLPLFHQKLGELYEKKGDRVKAAEYYRKLIEQWKNADPELQVIVNDLKSRVRRLSDNEGTRQ